MKKNLSRLAPLALFAVMALPLNASGYVIGPTSPGKWGNPLLGTGATVTWSLMGGNVSCGLLASGCTTTALDAFLPSGFMTEIRHAFDAWSAVANINFVQVPDDGAAFDSTTASGDIRIGALPLDGANSMLAFSFFPPLNGNSGAGDIFLDYSEPWKIGFGGSGYDVFQVVTHEIGHAIGLDHVTGVSALMNPWYSEAVRGLQADDIAGVRFLYGPRAPIPEPASMALFTLGLLGVGLQRLWRRRRD
ncbi:matrixin family metalloprotease [Azohydromonas aeria]|uniref:matrixin family metalloprotease n=1 Tax=Azohydromonas aeria TaxID=2590212 RepID=UPI0012FC8D18|nr:matrixin family metalloprotease [Azohydromonas aeria]